MSVPRVRSGAFGAALPRPEMARSVVDHADCPIRGQHPSARDPHVAQNSAVSASLRKSQQYWVHSGRAELHARRAELVCPESIAAALRGTGKAALQLRDGTSQI